MRSIESRARHIGYALGEIVLSRTRFERDIQYGARTRDIRRSGVRVLELPFSLVLPAVREDTHPQHELFFCSAHGLAAK